MNKIYNDDCFKIMKNIKDKSIDLIITDIPYGVINRKSNGLRNLNKGIADNAENINIKEMIKEFSRITKGSIYVFCATEQISEIRKEMINNKLSTRLIIWNKTNPSPMNGQHIWLSSIETCVFEKFPNATFNEHCKGSVLNYPIVRLKLHPTEKPVKLLEYLIQVSSNENDIILDPFAGSGSTGIACLNTNRKYILIEKEKEYYGTIMKRIKNQLEINSTEEEIEQNLINTYSSIVKIKNPKPISL